MEMQRLQAIESLQLSDSDNTVNCQKRDIAISIVGKLSRPFNDLAAILQRRTRWLENYNRGNINNNRNNELKRLKQELADLLAEDDNIAARFCVY
jgi:hypothetical protein